MFASPSSPTAGGGLLHEFRKKTMQKITKLTEPSASPITSPRPAAIDTSRRNILLSPRQAKDARATRDSQLAQLLHRFEEHDAQLKQLEAQLNEMLQQLQGACVAMGKVTEVFTQIFRYDALSYQAGVDYLATMKQMRRERAHLMDQAIRFTVVDPLSSRLARHEALRVKVTEWKQLQADVEKESQRRSADPAKLVVMNDQAEALELEMTQALDAATNVLAIRQLADLFTTMRLQLATFFFHTNESLISRLSETETEIVVGVGPTPRSPAAATKLRTRPKKMIDGDEEDPVSETHDKDPALYRATTSVSARTSNATLSTSSYSENDPEIDSDLSKTDELCVSITLEEFGLGKAIPQSPQATLVNEIKTNAQIQATVLPLPELLALASHPVVHTDPTEDEDDDAYGKSRHSRRQHSSTQRPQEEQKKDAKTKLVASEASVFASIRRSFNDTFGSPRGPEKAAFAASSPSPPVSPKKSAADIDVGPRCLEPLPVDEWTRVEISLWEFDAAKPLQCNAATASAGLPELLELDSALYAIGGFLCPPSIARLAKTNRQLHSHLVNCPAIWKRCIRQGGLTKATRSAVWLSVLYGGKPWLDTVASSNSNAVPHHLQSSAQRKKIYEGLLVKLGSRIADGLLHLPSTDESNDTETSQLVAWLREIDVDVARTCHRDIHGGVKSTIISSAAKPQPMNTRAHVEARIRRVLRAYVVYNPRVGYCQGMNFLVRLLTEVCGDGDGDEADCFWLFVGLCEPENDRNLYEPGLAVLQPLFHRFECVLATHKPDLHSHLSNEGVPVAAYTARWFLTFFSTFEAFEPSVVIRILDVFVVDGWRIVFAMAMVVLDILEPRLLGAEMEEMLHILQMPWEYLRGPQSDGKAQDALLQKGLAYCVAQAEHDALIERC